MNDLLDAITVKESTSGILLASKYVSTVFSCWSDEKCSEKFKHLGTEDQWAACVKEAAKRLVYRNDDMEFMQRSQGSKLTKGACLDFDCIITSTRIDRDDDVLEAQGAELDKSMPLLWQHVPLMPCGKFVSEIEANPDMRAGSYSIVDSELGRDAAQLVEFKALRISHGFRPLKYEPRKVEKDQRPGWHILKYDVMETSLVSIPSNIDATITAFSRGKLHHPLVKSWAEYCYRGRKTMVKSGWDGAALPPVTVNVNLGRKSRKAKTACSCPASDGNGSQASAKNSAVPETKPGVAKGSAPGYPRLWLGMAYFENSYEWVTDNLEDTARGHFTAQSMGVQPLDDLCVIATFPDYAVLCWHERQPYYGYGYPVAPAGDGDFDADDGYSFWRCNWANTEGKPQWSGMPEEIELTTAIRQATRGLVMKRLKAGRSVSAKNAALLKEADELVGLTAEHEKTIDEHKAYCKEARGHIQKVVGEPKEEEKTEEEKKVKGRVLSKEKLEMVQKARKACDDMAEHEKMHRGGKSWLREARGYLKEVMDNANPEAEVEGEENEGGDTKSVDDLAAQLTGALACGQKLAPGVLVTLKEVVDQANSELPDRMLAKV